MKVQVVMPSFNRPTLVQEVIKRVQTQTMTDWKLYIMDNSSPNLWPRMKEIYEKFAEKDARIKIDHIEVTNSERASKGRWVILVSVVNKAVFDLSENEPYVTFSTDDDLMMPNKLEVLTRFLDEHPEASMVAGVMEVIDDNGNVTRKIGGCDHPSGYGALDWLQPMYRRELLNKVGRLKFTKETKWLDASFFTIVAKCHNGVHGIPVTLDKQYARTKGTYTNKWRNKALRGDVME